MMMIVTTEQTFARTFCTEEEVLDRKSPFLSRDFHHTQMTAISQ
jgi:hypothetical protein